MFEKKAEEWVIDNVCKDCSRYEKCKSKEHCTCKECSKEKWKYGAEFGYNKVNEWHYVKDGDLPPERLEGKQILVVPQKHKFTEPMFVVGYYLLSEYRVGVEKKFYFDSDCRDEIDKPYAWKEIVLPEE